MTGIDVLRPTNVVMKDETVVRLEPYWVLDVLL
jgi:hypothetical protein